MLVVPHRPRRLPVTSREAAREIRRVIVAHLPGDFRHGHVRVLQQVPCRIEAVPGDKAGGRLAAGLRENLVEVGTVQAKVVCHVGRRDVSAQVFPYEILGLFHILLYGGFWCRFNRALGLAALFARQVAHELQEQAVAFDDALRAAGLDGFHDADEQFALAVKTLGKVYHRQTGRHRRLADHFGGGPAREAHPDILPRRLGVGGIMHRCLREQHEALPLAQRENLAARLERAAAGEYEVKHIVAAHVRAPGMAGQAAFIAAKQQLQVAQLKVEDIHIDIRHAGVGGQRQCTHLHRLMCTLLYIDIKRKATKVQ